MPTVAKATPLLELHQELGAKLTEFGGWDMPLQYEGTVSEHHAVRERAGLFDVSHLGKLLLEGPGAEGALQRALTCDVAAIEVGAAKYALVLNDDAGCIDDVFLYRLAGDSWLVVPNASNTDAVADAIREAGGEPVDVWDRWAILALQGPRSFDVFTTVWPDSDAPSLALHRWAPLDLSGGDGIVARTGYTGERGFEIYAPAAVAVEVARKLLDAGAAPVGLGARDTLRLEMGYALYGHEIDAATDPLSAGLGWAVSWEQPFRGRDALAKIKADGPSKRLFGFKATDRGVPRQGYEVTQGDAVIGRVVSGNFSPSLQTGIAIAFAPADRWPEQGSEVAVQARGRSVAGVVVRPPFVERGKKRN
ncbi:MAG: glycine cleavage system aminomethyltransferase GcvT [Actinomycetota bacterium]